MKFLHGKFNHNLKNSINTIPELADLCGLKEDEKKLEDSLFSLNNEELNQVNLGHGPADTPAIHDFHTLRMAFEDVWSEAFDDKILSTGKSLYEYWVRLQDFGINTDQRTISSVEDLKQFREDIIQTNYILAEQDYRFHAVQALVPEMTLYDWVMLDLSQRDTLYSFSLRAFDKVGGN